MEEESKEQKARRIPRYKLSLLLFGVGFSLLSALYYTAKFFLSHEPVEVIFSDIV